MKRNKGFKPPDIKKCNLHNLWWQDEKGSKKFLTEEQMKKGIACIPDPQKYPYAFSRFPLSVTTSCYRRRKDGGYGSKDIFFRSESGAPGDLAVRLVINSKFSMRLDHALMIASTACERCMNILACKNGCGWGYSPKSKEAKKCSTSCELCR